MKVLKLKYVIVAIIVIGSILLVPLKIGTSDIYQSFFMEKESVSYNQFRSMVSEKQVTKVIIRSEEVLEFVANDQYYKTLNPNSENFKEFLLLEDIVVSYNHFNLSSVLSTAFVLVVFVIVYLMMRKKGAKDRIVINSIVNKRNRQQTIVKFDDVAGNGEAKLMVKDVVDFLKAPKKYETIGAKMPKGILLYGAPGTGKTLMAKAIAGEADVPFYALSGSDFVQMYVGVGAKRVRELFAQARKSKKAIIFIDEIDALGKSRSHDSSGNNDERDQTLNALLTEMSGFKSGEGIVVIGATNRRDILDKALLRPGRFDRQIEVALPDVVARKKILDLYLEGKPVEEEMDVETLAKKTSSFSGAMLEQLVNEAAILTANNQCKVITKDFMQEAFYHIVAGRNKEMYKDKKELHVTAVHEAGHGLMTHLLAPGIVIDKMTIIPTINGAAGFNYNIAEDKMYYTQKDILNGICILLAGRAAEEVVFGIENITTGCSNDVKVASERLYNYFKSFGMDEEYGLFSHERITDDSFLNKKCREKMKGLYDETREIIIAHKEELLDLSKVLFEKETLLQDEIREILVA